MLRPLDADDADRRFYLCKCCWKRVTLLIQINGLADDWPRDIFDQAVRDGILSEEGRRAPLRLPAVLLGQEAFQRGLDWQGDVLSELPAPKQVLDLGPPVLGELAVLGLQGPAELDAGLAVADPPDAASAVERDVHDEPFRLAVPGAREHILSTVANLAHEAHQGGRASSACPPWV
jgi:hypothetical protein